MQNTISCAEKYVVVYLPQEVIKMKVTIAIDSFKGSLTSLEAGKAVQEAIARLDKDAVVAVRPLADGGEGTVAALSTLPDAETVEISVCGPLETPVKAKYCILRDTNTAVMEMAEASGINLVPREQLNPLRTTTYGVGELIADAMDRGCRSFLIGIGGSATNDGGVGMLQALGFRFLDEQGADIACGAAGLEQLRSISAQNVHPTLKECKFRIACDVDNPLCGEKGCSRVYGPQKGATDTMVSRMDMWLERYAELVRAYNPQADANREGAGAAGGLGFAFAAFTDAVLEPGVQIVLEETKLEEHIKDADLVVTGEGRLDGQTVMGKAPVGVARLAKKYGKRVIAFSGCVAEDAELCNQYGIDAYFPILRRISTLEEALETKTAYQNLRDTAYQVFRLILLK